jgi:hypothetical protein
VALLLLGGALGFSGPAFAQTAPLTDADVAPSDPPAEPVPSRPAPRRHYRDPNPPAGWADAPAWTWWLGAGAGIRGVGPAVGSLRPAVEARLGLGLELTNVYVGRYHQLQIGPWLEAVGDLAGALGEGGLELGLTKEDYNGSFYGLRVGGGYGLGPSDRGAALAGSLLFGLRHVLGECAYLYHAVGWRAFATARVWPTQGRGVTVVVGVEIDPSLLFSSEDDRYWYGLDRYGEHRCEVAD